MCFISYRVRLARAPDGCHQIPPCKSQITCRAWQQHGCLQLGCSSLTIAWLPSMGATMPPRCPGRPSSKITDCRRCWKPASLSTEREALGCGSPFCSRRMLSSLSPARCYSWPIRTKFWRVDIVICMWSEALTALTSRPAVKNVPPYSRHARLITCRQLSLTPCQRMRRICGQARPSHGTKYSYSMCTAHP